MKSFNFRFVLKTLGILLIVESILICLAALVAYHYKEVCANTMLLCATGTCLFGILLRLLGQERTSKPVGKRESFLVVTLVWIILSLFGMFPFYFSGAIPSITDAYFETMSGFTTTGASILRNIEAMPRGLLFWRALTQWMGGIGMVVFALALLPMVGGNSSALFDAESSGIVQDRFRPRVTQVAKRLWAIYIVFTAVLCFLLYLGPMDFFDSLCHAMTTLSTGGYSTKQTGVAYWNSPYSEYMICIFMFIGGVNFSLFYFMAKGFAMKLFKDEELRWYTIICIGTSVFVALCLNYSGQIPDLEKSFRYSLFQILSVATSTGFTVPDYMSWGAFYFFTMCLLMVFCACAGSTSGGIKIVRLMVLVKDAINHFKLQVHPNAILPVRLNGSVLPTEVVRKVLAFIFLYVGILAISFLILSFTGMGFEESVGDAISCMGNVGPGLGASGLKGHFAGVPNFSKWYLSFLMLTGRLEIFTVLSLFIPSFWKK